MMVRYNYQYRNQMLRVSVVDGTMEVKVIAHTGHLATGDFVNASIGLTVSGELRIVGDKVEVFDIDTQCEWWKRALKFTDGSRHSRIRIVVKSTTNGFDIPSDHYTEYKIGVISREGFLETPRKVKEITDGDIVEDTWRNAWDILRSKKFTSDDVMEIIEFNPDVRPHYSKVRSKGIAITSNVYVIKGAHNLPNQGEALLG